MPDERKRPTAKEVARRTIKRLKAFSEKLRLGIPIEATEVQRIETPDGPMHVRKRVVIEKGE